MPFKLTHPDSKQEIEVESDQTAIYISQGWVSKPGAPNPDPVVGEQGAEIYVPPSGGTSTETKD